jgi:hypothetical protein
MRLVAKRPHRRAELFPQSGGLRKFGKEGERPGEAGMIVAGVNGAK